MATRHQTGIEMDHTPDAAVTAGDVVVVGSRALVAEVAIAAAALGALATRGVFKFTRAATSGADVGLGTVMYWDATDEEPTTDADSGTNKKLGYAYETLEATDTTWLIELSP